MKTEKLFEEGQRSVSRKTDTTGSAEKEENRIDPRKMIIYSELLKPKFDEGLN